MLVKYCKLCNHRNGIRFQKAATHLSLISEEIKVIYFIQLQGKTKKKRILDTFGQYISVIFQLTNLTKEE